MGPVSNITGGGGVWESKRKGWGKNGRARRQTLGGEFSNKGEYVGVLKKALGRCREMTRKKVGSVCLVLDGERRVGSDVVLRLDFKARGGEKKS